MSHRAAQQRGVVVIRAGVFIGVDQTGGLVRLRDAAACAERMRDWALAQGFSPENAVLVSDAEGQKVNTDRIFDAIQKIINGPGVDQLLVYYAGHGVNIRHNEQWLLSEAPEKSYAAVNMSGSAELARYCGIGHVVIISDACRVAPAGIQASGVQGVEVFPSDGGGQQPGAVDRYWACRIGRPAAEVADPGAANGYTAIYTEALLEALSGRHPDVFDPPGTDPARYVWGHTLRDWLLQEIPARLRARKVQFPQIPDAYLVRDGVQWLARHQPADLPPPNLVTPAAPSTDPLAGVHALTQVALAGDGQAVATALDDLRADPSTLGVGFADTAAAVAADFGPDHFETECGIKVNGAEIANAFAHGAHLDILTPKLVRIDDLHGPAASVLVQLGDGTGALVPAIPGFLTALTFDGDELVDVAHEPSANSMQWDFYRGRAEELRRLRGIAAAATLHGRFQLTDEDSMAVANSMRIGKSVSPMMAVYAAYAYHDLQRPDLIADMARYLQSGLDVSFFDVELLRGALKDRTIDASLPLVPFLPMLAQGWAFLRAHRVGPTERFAKLERTLCDSLWSRFRPDGVDEIRSVLMTGGVR